MRRGVEFDGGGGSEVCLTSGIVFDYEFIGEPSYARTRKPSKIPEQAMEGNEERRASVIFCIKMKEGLCRTLYSPLVVQPVTAVTD